MSERMARVDRATILCFEADAQGPTPERAPVRRTPEGYLEADAYLARDGILTYSDGIETWQEWRPREELESAALSWQLSPVTDDHPPVMVTSDNYREYSRGMVMSDPTVEEVDGVAYLRARLRVTDAELISKLEAGEQREVSIGFTATIAPEKGVADGVRYDAVQRALQGNHVAAVPKGRAGPAVRVFLDGANVPVTYHGESGVKNEKPKVAAKVDEVGVPTDMVQVQSPSGEVAMVPTWIAAILEDYMRLKQEEPAEPGEPPPHAAEPAPVSPAPAPTDAAGDPAAPLTEEEKQKAQLASADAINALVRRRVRLARLADKEGLDADKYDADQDLARAFIAAKLPGYKADGLSDLELWAVVEAAASVVPPVANPFTVAVKTDSVQDDLVASEIRFLRNQGLK